jgi:hypothetical protein
MVTNAEYEPTITGADREDGCRRVCHSVMNLRMIPSSVWLGFDCPYNNLIDHRIRTVSARQSIMTDRRFVGGSVGVVLEIAISQSPYSGPLGSRDKVR